MTRWLTALLGLALVAYAISDHPMYGGARGFGASQAVIVGLGCGLLLSTRLTHRANASILLVSLSGLFSLAVVEVAAGMFLSPLYRPCFQEDERLLFTLRPNCSSIFVRNAINGGDRVFYRINSDGFRGAELQPFPTGLRVVVHGDSFIHAVYSPDEETFVVQLEAQLTQRLQTQVEVINAGVNGYGPDQVSLRLADDLRTLRPDVVVVAVYAGND